MQSMTARKISISELRHIIDDLSMLEPNLLISSHIDFDLLKMIHGMAIKRHFRIGVQ